MRLRVIDLDGSVACQPPFLRRLESGASLVAARDLATSLRILARRSVMRAFTERVAAATPAGNDATVSFYGSGDFHHLAAGLVAGVEQKVTLIHFDNHPDWVRFPPTFNCGAWVNRALELPHVERIITIGPCSDDLVWPEWKSANLRAISQGKLALFAWRAAPSRVFGRYGEGCGQSGNRLHWRNLADENWDEFLDGLIAELPQAALWISIDKDVLGPAEAVTNWDQGAMPLTHVITAVERLAGARRIAGIDVCGDFSEPEFGDPFRAALAYFDHPAREAVPADAGNVNARTNEALLACFERVLS